MENPTVYSVKEYAWKKKATIFGLYLASATLTVRFLTELMITPRVEVSNYITISAVILFLGLVFYVKKSKRYEGALFFVLTLSYGLIYIRASFTGELSSPAMAWTPVVPILSSFLLNKKYTVIIFILALICMLMTMFYPFTNILNVAPEELSNYSKFFIYLAIVTTTTLICLSHEANRVLMRKKIEEQRVSILSNSRSTELSELAASIAHEINNPLTVIKVKAKKIKSKTSDKSDQVTDSIEKIISMTDRINKVVKSMKNLSKVQRQGEEKENTNFTYIFENILTLCETKMKYSNIQFQLKNNVKDIDQYKVPIQLGHILLNLINNAYDAVLDVENKWIKVSTFINGDLLEIRVSDSGNGIARIDEKKIFNPFFTTKQDRTGLGLSTSKSNLASLGGEVILESRTNFTTFLISLTAKKSNAVA